MTRQSEDLTTPILSDLGSRGEGFVSPKAEAARIDRINGRLRLHNLVLRKRSGIWSLLLTKFMGAGKVLALYGTSPSVDDLIPEAQRLIDDIYRKKRKGQKKHAITKRNRLASSATNVIERENVDV